MMIVPKRVYSLLWIGLIGLIFGLAACDLGSMETGPLQTKLETIEVGNAATVTVDVDMGIGKMSVAGGASNLMEGTFSYNVADWEPEVSYDVSGENGRLTIKQPDVFVEGFPDENLEYVWNLQFNEDVPMNMHISLGAGESNLNLAKLTLETVTVETGAGETEIRLGGSPLRQADIDAGVGEVLLDMTGDWDADATVSVEAGVGSFTVVVPSDIGVIVNADMGLGDLNANGFRMEGDSYVNEAYEDSPVTLTVSIDGGIGDITLLLEQ
ncbi:MAG: hypothetical protein GY796_09130 [Chloroflexi bacterium]|nr:hypothetical protein [Chloroflexota bacterium]